MENIGEKIKDLRKQKKLTLRDVGEKINVSYSNLSKIENGQYKPNINILNSLASLFTVDISYFFNDTEEDPFIKFFKNIIQFKRLEKKYTIESLAEKINISPNTLSSLEEKGSIINRDILYKLKTTLDIPSEIIHMYEDSFLATKDLKNNNIDDFGDSSIDNQIEVIKIPILNYNQVLVNIKETELYKYLSMVEAGNGDFFYYLIPDNSMINARICKGDYVLVKEQKSIADGKIGIMIIDNKVKVKRVFYKDNDNVILISESIGSSPYLVHRNNINFLGEIIKVEFSI